MCMVTDNMGLVGYTLKKYFSGSLNTYDYDDLFQVGCVGLIKAVKRFDESKELQFATYAVAIIRGEIGRHIRDNNPVHIPRSLVTDRTKVIPYQNEDVGVICEKTGFEADKVKELLRLLIPPKSLSYNVSDGKGEDTLLEEVLVTGAGFEDELIESLDLKNALNVLTHKQRKAVLMYYYDELSQPQIAKSLGVSQVTISRNLDRALQKMRMYA